MINERLDIDLVANVAKERPDWHFVMIGPIVKIDPAALPQLPNIHYLGGKDYKDLPKYIAGWDVAVIPFAMNESTKFISPTKTPEYLAAGKPVISTPIRDVIRPYADNKLVHIASTPEDFVFMGRELETGLKPLNKVIFLSYSWIDLESNVRPIENIFHFSNNPHSPVMASCVYMQGF